MRNATVCTGRGGATRQLYLARLDSISFLFFSYLLLYLPAYFPFHCFLSEDVILAYAREHKNGRCIIDRAILLR